MAQYQARVVTCVPGTPQYEGSALSTGVDPVSCLLPDGVHYGRPVIVDAYLSDQPIADGTAQTQVPQNWQELGNMSMADAQLISGYIALLWAGMWGAKQVIRALFTNEGVKDE